MHYNFCTLFDKNYCTRGLALYQSLERHGGDFTLWILCMDNDVYTILKKLDLPHTKLLRLDEVEDDELRRIKPTRSVGEYCWTLTPSLPLYILTNYPELDHITYLDADTYFFSSPRPLYDEWIDHSILIVKHNYARRFTYKETVSGIYNVEFLIFKNDADGLACLCWWRERCNEWCYFRFEDGKFGDQLYLNDWPTRLPGVKVLEHPGGGVAPWNLENFHFRNLAGQTLINDQPVVFFHYHAFKWYHGDIYEPLEGYYYYPATVKSLIYEPYLRALQASLRLIRTVQPEFASGFSTISNWQRWQRSSILWAMNQLPLNWLYQRWKNS